MNSIFHLTVVVRRAKNTDNRQIQIANTDTDGSCFSPHCSCEESWGGEEEGGQGSRLRLRRDRIGILLLTLIVMLIFCCWNCVLWSYLWGAGGRGWGQVAKSSPVSRWIIHLQQMSLHGYGRSIANYGQLLMKMKYGLLVSCSWRLFTFDDTN